VQGVSLVVSSLVSWFKTFSFEGSSPQDVGFLIIISGALVQDYVDWLVSSKDAGSGLFALSHRLIGTSGVLLLVCGVQVQ
jgi:hypothetical protein